MSDQQGTNNWHLLADKFIWSDETALSLISKEISNEEIQKYLYTYHGDYMSLEEIKKWRIEHVKDQ